MAGARWRVAGEGTWYTPGGSSFTMVKSRPERCSGCRVVQLSKLPSTSTWFPPWLPARPATSDPLPSPSLPPLRSQHGRLAQTLMLLKAFANCGAKVDHRICGSARQALAAIENSAAIVAAPDCCLPCSRRLRKLVAAVAGAASPSSSPCNIAGRSVRIARRLGVVSLRRINAAGGEAQGKTPGSCLAATGGSSTPEDFPPPLSAGPTAGTHR